VNTSDSKPIENEKQIKMGKKDNVFNYYSKWPIFILHTLDQTGIWLKIKTKIDIWEYQNILQDLTIEEIDNYLYKNPDIEFETNVFDEMLPDFYFFKYKNKIYTYTTGKKGKDKVRIYARFYFDIDEILAIDL
jgi:hypothetical protein